MNRKRHPITVIATLALVVAMVHVFVFVQTWPHRQAIAAQIANENSHCAASTRAAEALADTARDADALRADLARVSTTLPDDAAVNGMAQSLAGVADENNVDLSCLRIGSGTPINHWAIRTVSLHIRGASRDIASVLAQIEALPTHPHVQHCHLASSGTDEPEADITLTVLCNSSTGGTP